MCLKCWQNLAETYQELTTPDKFTMLQTKSLDFEWENLTHTCAPGPVWSHNYFLVHSGMTYLIKSLLALGQNCFSHVADNLPGSPILIQYGRLWRKLASFWILDNMQSETFTYTFICQALGPQDLSVLKSMDSNDTRTTKILSLNISKLTPLIDCY